jgi:plastocyanin
MRPTQRQLVQTALFGMGGLALHTRGLSADAVIDIEMRGTARGTSVWFDPVGLHIEPGQTIRWINADSGNSHTATAYHPANDGRPLRIPESAEPRDSDYLLLGASFSVTLSQDGVYDYLCIPHEMAGMVGRIVVGRPNYDPYEADDLDTLPQRALAAFPSVEEIIRRGVVPAPR